MSTYFTCDRRLSATALSLMAAALQAATYYVSPTGSDSAAGTSDTTPFLTIQRGVGAAAPGDTVLVAPGTYGTYSTDKQTTTPASGYSRVAITENITVRSTHGAAQTVIRGQPHSDTLRFGANCVRCVYMSAGTLDGFTLLDGYANAVAPGSSMTDPVKNGGGVYAPDNNRTPQVNNCIITGCGAYRGAGAHWATLNNCTVVSNYVNSTSGTGIFSCHVRNSIIQFNGEKNDENFPSDVQSVDRSLFISSCTDPAPGLNFYGDNRDGGNNTVEDPLFKAGTLLLSDASPCINAGDNTYTNGTLDAGGGARVQGGTVDMGAYERASLHNKLTVLNGTGSGSYTNGAIVPILAYATNAWFLFTGWTGDVATVANTSSTNTTLTMPDRNITVGATFRALSLDEYLSRILGIPLPVTTGNIGFGDVNPGVPEVMLGTVGDSQSAFLSTVYTNAGTLIFSWRVSSEAGCDRLTLIIDGSETNAISGNASGSVTQFIAGAAAHTVQWAYSKDGSDEYGADAGWVGPVMWIPDALASELGVPGKPVAFPNGQPGAPLPFPYGFEACFLDTATVPAGGDGTAVKLGGLDSAGIPLFADNTAHGVEAVLYGSGELTFNWCTSNQLSDPVIFTIDGVEAARTSGTKNGWLTFTTNLLTATPHVLRWSYTKDASGFRGADAAWIDDVAWTRYAHTLTVESGTGGGLTPVGDSVAIAANPAPAGQEFDVWDGDTETVTDITAPETTLVMPNRDITVRALYKLQRFPVSIINGRDAGAWPNAVNESTGEPEGEYAYGSRVRIVAAPAPLWYTFDRWTSSDGTVVFSNAWDDVAWFYMPSNAVTITATYRPQSDTEKLGNALTIRGQPLTVTAFSPSGIVAIASGGIRYDDPVVQMGGPSVGPSQNVYLSTTNFTGNGILFFWWHGDAEAEYDGLTLEVNGATASPLYSEKNTNAVDKTRWYLYGFRLTGATNITWRFTRDENYFVHNNMIQLDRVTWLPQDMIGALSAGACFPNINAEYDPLFQGRDHASGTFDFEGEDGGVAWVHDAPGGGDAIRLGRFGYVTNNACAQVAVTNFGTGILSWEWTASSEADYDTLGYYIDGVKTNWISGKLDGGWYFTAFAVTADYLNEKNNAANIHCFRYQKDADVSVLDDCAWLRNVHWSPTHKLIVENGRIETGSVGGEGYYMGGMPVTIQANLPEDGYYFDAWTGTNLASLGFSVTDPNPTFPMPDHDLTLTATYTTNAPVLPHYTLTVTNGTGDGSYLSGTAVVIEATPSSQWQTFSGWTGNTNTVADPSATPTTILIGSNALAVTATFVSMPLETIIMNVLGVPSPVVAGPLLTLENIGADSVNLGLIGDDQTNFFTTVYTNAGTVIFPWSVDSEEGWDFFRFSVDGTTVFSASGKQSGVLTNFIAGDGPHVLRWAYEKDISGLAGTDSAVIGKVLWIPDALARELGTPGRLPYAPNGFDAALLDSAPPADAVGDLAVRLGGTGTVAHSSSVTLGTVYSGSGKLSFHWRASSEQSRDYLILMVDGAEAARISGTKTGWLLFETNLLASAEHAVQWIYSKDGSVSAGSDCGWIDSVTWAQFTYTLTVEAGDGSSTNAVGDIVSIAADPAPSGMEFDEWDGDIETVADPASAATTLVMPARDITVRALYRTKTLTVTVINGRDGGAWPNSYHESTGEPEGAYPAGAEVRIIAGTAPLWQTFSHWDSTNGAVFADTQAAITTFTMPSNSVTVTAVYRPQTAAEKLAGALTIAGQPLNVTSFSSNGIVVESSGGVRYNDPVVKFGGPSVGAGQSVALTVTNFIGDGVLLLWWKGGAETAYDGLEVLVNGTPINSVSRKCSTWGHMTNFVTDADSITLRFSRDPSYYVRDNTITVDRLVWIPQALINALGCVPSIPNINGEATSFDGEDGGVSWVNDAPGTNSAIRFGRFGYVNNNQHAQLSVTNYGTGILRWEWASSSEAVADQLDFYSDDRDSDTIKRWISGKEETWYDAMYVVKNGESDRETARKALRTFLFKYGKDTDVSVLQDCAWLRSGIWTPTSLLTLESATNLSYTLPAAFVGDPDVVEEAKRKIYPEGTTVTIIPEKPEEGYYFESWDGDVACLASPVTVMTNRVTMPAFDITLRATYTTNAPAGPLSMSPLSTANAKITAFAMRPPAASTTVKLSSASTPTATVVILFEGLPQTDYVMEWTPTLSGSGTLWQPLTVTYREVLGDTPDGTRQVKLHVEIPADTPQGFFRLRNPD